MPYKEIYANFSINSWYYKRVEQQVVKLQQLSITQIRFIKNHQFILYS